MALCLQNRPSPSLQVPSPYLQMAILWDTLLDLVIWHPHWLLSGQLLWAHQITPQILLPNNILHPPKFASGSNQDINNNYMDIVMNNDGQLFMQDDFWQGWDGGWWTWGCCKEPSKRCRCLCSQWCKFLLIILLFSDIINHRAGSVSNPHQTLWPYQCHYGPSNISHCSTS